MRNLIDVSLSSRSEIMDEASSRVFHRQTLSQAAPDRRRRPGEQSVRDAGSRPVSEISGYHQPPVSWSLALTQLTALT